MAMSPRLMRPMASGGFLPSSISGLELWLDASQSSTVTLNGSLVSEWRDRRSSSTVKASQTVASQQPTWVTSSKNNLGGINFPAGKSLAISGAFAFSQPTTYFFVFQSPTSSGTWAFFDGTTTRQHVFGNSATEFRMFAGGTLGPITITQTFYAGILTYNGTSSSARLNTKTATTGNPGTNAINGLFVGSSSGIRGDVNEFGMFSKALSADESGKILDYLSKKWAITLA